MTTCILTNCFLYLSLGMKKTMSCRLRYVIVLCWPRFKMTIPGCQCRALWPGRRDTGQELLQGCRAHTGQRGCCLDGSPKCPIQDLRNKKMRFFSIHLYSSMWIFFSLSMTTMITCLSWGPRKLRSSTLFHFWCQHQPAGLHLRSYGTGGAQQLCMGNQHKDWGFFFLAALTCSIFDPVSHPAVDALPLLPGCVDAGGMRLWLGLQVEGVQEGPPDELQWPAMATAFQNASVNKQD